ncbi:YpdA family putative bacillithiol disulfide reductase [Mesobacillus subterraneus]|uniref:YpdA family putative bacillithiol disulfide reductase n=1 Tax=Mesobacillus subterraneus TaxID=285983 RepID=UPI00273CFE19|nr:YpdA family putative bacillithiol disulfide reductase [Mesobacillus subterraneus]WLR56523.1 YpdA family putative bacillithiol disulfide reductase [Mesobacillus subterraneus]
MNKEDVIIVGGVPCGLSAAIALQKKGMNPLIIEKGNIVNAIYNYPTHQTFFSSSEKLAIGDVPFITENLKPKRNQALVYYREVVKLEKLRVNKYERVTEIVKSQESLFEVTTDKQKYIAQNIVIATGYYDNPNFMGIPGEELEKVSHYFKEAHPFFDMDVAVIGGKNSSVDAGIELEKAGARVTVLYRGAEYSPSIKPWVLPEFEALVKTGVVDMVFNAQVKEITKDSIVYEQDGELVELKNDHVFAMTGYLRPDHTFLQKMGVKIEAETGRPHFDPETMETNVPGIYIAGVIAAGNNANEIFIENGRFHGGQIAEAISSQS